MPVTGNTMAVVKSLLTRTSKNHCTHTHTERTRPRLLTIARTFRCCIAVLHCQEQDRTLNSALSPVFAGNRFSRYGELCCLLFSIKILQNERKIINSIVIRSIEVEIGSVSKQATNQARYDD